MKVTIKVDGMRALERALIDLAEEIGPTKGRNVLRKSLQQAAKPMADDARNRAPEDTGGLKRSIKFGGVLNAGQKKKHKKESDLEVFIGPSGSSKAIVQEFGSSEQGPQPYMRPAWEAGRDKMLKDMTEALSKNIDAAAMRAARKRAKG